MAAAARRRSYRSLLGPPTTIWQVALGAAGVLAASVPAVVFSGELTSALYGQDAIRADVRHGRPAPWASVVSVLVVPLLAELAEPVAYLGVVLPGWRNALAGPGWPPPSWSRCGRPSTPCTRCWFSGGGLDWGFAAYRVGSVLPYLAAWTAPYYALGRRLLPIMAARWVLNAGTAAALALGLVA